MGVRSSPSCSGKTTGRCALLVVLATALGRETMAFEALQPYRVRQINEVVKSRLGYWRPSPKLNIRPKGAFRLFQSDPDNHFNEVDRQLGSGGDLDSIRRRRILFSMLYGSAALNSLSASVGAEEGAMALQEEEIKLASQATNDGVINILKPPKDDREYFTYTLDNGLRVLLCSDPSSNEAAAAMDVHVGACSDPVNIPGMAHFTGTWTWETSQDGRNDDIPFPWSHLTLQH
jgi:hypothetical protein